MKKWEKDIEEIKARLSMDENQRLILAELPMILTPRMFFVNIQKRVEKEAGIDVGRSIYYEAAFESAYRYLENSKEVYGVTGRDLLQQYLDSLTVRGWGKFQILSLSLEGGEARVRLDHSGIAEEFGVIGRSVCHVWAGAMAGSVQFFVAQRNKQMKIEGTEPLCVSRGDRYCEFVVAPLATGQERIRRERTR